jgi:hypothetical protein
MYGLVPYNLSPIQQGIQYGHAVVEYSLKFGGSTPYKRWAEHDKTFIILNGGTTNTRRFNGELVGSLNQYRKELIDRKIWIADFNEPDLGDQLTAVVFLIDDRVFDRVTWPDYDGPTYLDGTPMEGDYWNWKMKFDDDDIVADNIVWLRSWLPKFRLA